MVLLGGQFKSATHGQFKSAQGGQFDRILHHISQCCVIVMVVRNQRIGHQLGISETHTWAFNWYFTMIVKGFGNFVAVIIEFKTHHMPVPVFKPGRVINF